MQSSCGMSVYPKTSKFLQGVGLGRFLYRNKGGLAYFLPLLFGLKFGLFLGVGSTPVLLIMRIILNMRQGA